MLLTVSAVQRPISRMKSIKGEIYTKVLGHTVPKRQRSVSIPIEYYERLEKFFREWSNDLEKLEITTVSELLRVLANFGQESLLRTLEQARKFRKTTEGSHLEQ